MSLLTLATGDEPIASALIYFLIAIGVTVLALVLFIILHFLVSLTSCHLEPWASSLQTSHVYGNRSIVLQMFWNDIQLQSRGKTPNNHFVISYLFFFAVGTSSCNLEKKNLNWVGKTYTSSS